MDLRRAAAAALLWIAALLSSACSTTLYAPNMTPVPLLRERGQLQVALGTRNAQLAFAPVDGVTVAANGLFALEEASERNGTRVRRGGWLVEAGAGPHGELFLPNLRWEVLAGVGVGHVEGASSGSIARSYSGEGVRTFVQPNVGYVTPWFEVSGALRLSGVNYTRFDSSGYSPEALRAEGIPQGLTGRPYLFAEPSITVKAGYKWVKAYLQRGWSLQVAGAIPAEDDFASVGLAVDVAQWFDTFQWSRN